MGIGAMNLKTVEHNSAMRIVASKLDASISKDREQGRVPIAVIASAGTVNSGAIDSLEEIADICARHNVNGCMSMARMEHQQFSDQSIG
jgi:aromatic-L-amino-acid/L-tryptophan decarboxylase